MEADLLKEYEMFHIFDNCILQLEEVSNTVRVIPPGGSQKSQAELSQWKLLCSQCLQNSGPDSSCRVLENVATSSLENLTERARKPHATS